MKTIQRIPRILAVVVLASRAGLAAPLLAYTLMPDPVDLRGGGPDPSPTVVNCSQIGDNGVITENTTLTDDLVSSYGTCLTIGADDVTLDCDGHTISGIGIEYGVFADGVRNPVVRNCNIENFGMDVDFRSVTGGEV